MSDLLSIGASAVNAYRGALETIGNNVANAQTDGYSRRTTRLSEYRPGTNIDVGYNSITGGYGVRRDGVTRAWNAFAAAEVRSASANAATADAHANWLSSIESAMGTVGSDIGSAMAGVFSAGTALAADPRSIPLRAQFLSAMEAVAAQFRQTGSALDRVAPAIGESAQIAVDTLNAGLAALNSTNRAIIVAGEGTGARAALEDERDAALASLSAIVGIDVTLDARGAATVSVAGAPGQILLDAQGPTLVRLTIAADGRVSPIVGSDSSAAPLAAQSGELAGLVAVSQHQATQRLNIDTLAADFAALINGWASGGVDRNGAPGAPLLTGSSAATLSLTTNDPALVPAATAGGAANANLLALETLRSASGVEARWSAIASDTSLAAVSARRDADTLAQLRDGRVAALDEVSGVNLDREAADLVRYEQAYGASTRIIQVARDTMNAIFAIF